jgi:hypothetical protein
VLTLGRRQKKILEENAESSVRLRKPDFRYRNLNVTQTTDMVWTEKDSNALNMSGVSCNRDKANLFTCATMKEQGLCAGLQILQFRIDNADRSL